MAHAGYFFAPVLIPWLVYSSNSNRPFVRAVAVQATAAQAVSSVGGMLAFLAVFGLHVYGIVTQSTWLAPEFMMFAILVVPLLVLLLGVAWTALGAFYAWKGLVWRVPLVGGFAARATRTRDEDFRSEVEEA